MNRLAEGPVDDAGEKGLSFSEDGCIAENWVRVSISNVCSSTQIWGEFKERG